MMRQYLILSILIVVFLSAAVPVPQTPGSPCSQAYGGSLPDPLPGWLQSEVGLEALTTTNSYELLAGQLLKTGIIDGASCPSGGLNTDGSPNGCGLQVAKAAVNDWQNRYNATILSVSRQQGVPPKVLKALIAVESQFWPGASWEKGEIGLGQMTTLGADLLLTWRPVVYQSICRQGLDEAACAKGYVALDESDQWLLDATCPSCSGGIDPAKGDVAVSMLAETLNASCQQTARTFRLAQGKSPAVIMSYEEFWRMALDNYHVGTGCIYQALQKTGNPDSWGAIALNLPANCRSGVEYIRRIEEQLIP
jgi:hypothetical protein